MRYLLFLLLAGMLGPGVGIAQKKADSVQMYKGFVTKRVNRTNAMVNALNVLPLNKCDSLKSFVNKSVLEFDIMISELTAMKPFRNSTRLRDAGIALIRFYKEFFQTFYAFIPAESDATGKVIDFIGVDDSRERKLKREYSNALLNLAELVKKK